MSSAQTQILNDLQVKQMLRRMAYQVLERNFGEKEVVIAGISGRGAEVARMLAEQLEAICDFKVSNLEVHVNKDEPSEASTSLSDTAIKLNGKAVVVVDDVLNTGRTMVYALIPFIRGRARIIQTAVLVDRDHKSFPLHADYIGMSLSTTLQEHITVTLEKKKVNVYLS